MLSDLFNYRPHRQLTGFLADRANALFGNSASLDRFIGPYDRIAVDQVEGFADIVERLSRTLVEVKPSDAFVEQLRQQLLFGQRPDPQTMWQRIHQLPLRMRLAAGIGGATLTAGVLLIASRPYLMDVLTSWRDR